MLKLRTLMVAAALVCGCVPAAAGAVTETASLHASFTPNKLGAPTTLQFGFQLSTTEGGAPPPLASINLFMPAGMNYTQTTLGLAICQPEVLKEKGLAGCPADSRLGSGTAVVEVPFGTGTGHELPEIQALMGPPTAASNIVVLFYANGQTPVFAQLVFRGELLPASGLFSNSLETLVPPISSVPNGPDVSIVSVESTIGPAHLDYTKKVHGKIVHFHPVGISVPEHCPSGGFPFSAEFGFQDGTHTSTASTVPCPPPVKKKHKHK
jgi:hypothetical protein